MDAQTFAPPAEPSEDDVSAGVMSPEEAAEEAGLLYIRDDGPGITRERAEDGAWRYLSPKGKPVTDAKTIARIDSLAIPPAYTDVWICPKANGHIQATGRDARGRKQYRYHPKFREVREANKYERMLEFARALPAIRARIAEDMGRRGLPREKVLATIVYLLENTLIRVGNDEYAKTNKSFGLTTLRDRHVKIDGSDIRFRFKGKSGKEWDLKLKDRRVAKIVKAAQDVPGQHLFQYIDENGERREVTSTDVNAYLHEIGGPHITAKDFRTWGGTVLAAIALHEVEAADTDRAAKKAIKAAIERVSAQLGNTPTICRKCYVHPEVLDSYMNKSLVLDIIEEIEEDLAQGDRLRPEEQAVLRFLEARLEKAAAETKDGPVDLSEALGKSLAAA